MTPPMSTRVEHTVERPLVCNVINEENTHSTSVVCRGDGPKALLSRRVPYLQLYPLAVQFDRTDLEVDTDGSDERWGK